MSRYLGSALQASNLAAARSAAKASTVHCDRCGKTMPKGAARQHERACSLGRSCPVCGEWFYSKSKTCSYACANTYFRSGPKHANWKEDSYQSTCFHHHGKRCVVCGEENIVEAHHMDEDRTNNSPENLIPLCPTHHQYWHSRFRSLVEPAISEYIVLRASRKAGLG